MWMMTPQGFFSAVQHNADEDLLVIRTRDFMDAERLKAWYTAWGPFKGDPQPAIITYGGSDYPWRVIMPKAAWAEYVTAAAGAIDYGNFKDAVKAAQGPVRARIYGDVWFALLALEGQDPHGRANQAWEELGEP